MSLRQQMESFTGACVSDTGLLGEPFALTQEDGSTVTFSGTLTMLDSDEMGERQILLARVSDFTVSPELMEVVTRLSDDMEWSIHHLEDEAGVYKFSLSREERVDR